MKQVLLAAALAAGLAFAAGLALAGQADVATGGRAYLAGDYAKALNELMPLARQGEAEAQYLIGVMHAHGQGVERNYPEAESWYRQAAEQGRARGQALLGSMYAAGRSVPQDFVLALKWLNLAASDAEKRNVTVKLRDIIAKKMTPAQIAEAQRLAREWMTAFEKRKKK